jgi:DNA-binding NarL/FixJ family response regulator
MVPMPTSTPIPVWILSDHRLLGEGLRSLLGTEADLHVELLTLAAAAAYGGVTTGHQSVALPQVVLLDSEAPGALGWCSRLVHRYPGAAVVVVGASGDEAWALDALCAGARGLVLRTGSLEDLTKAIRVVRDGQIWAPKSVVARALDRLAGIHGADDRLTPREREMLNHLLRGLSNREIAERAAISQATVKAHVTNIFRKLSVRDRTQLVVRYQGRTTTTLG